MTGREHLGPELWDQLVAGVAREEYHLLLGAGASIGAKGGDGRPLGTATDLAKEIAEDFQVPLGGGSIGLRDAYEAAEHRATVGGQSRTDYFKSRFCKCEPSWQSSLFALRWPRIWNLNIDDVTQAAHASAKSDQPLRSFSWTDRHEDRDSRTNEVQHVLLHGSVSRESRLVFSIAEYLRATTADDRTWHRIFGDHFSSYPFIVVGARLSDEFDLADVIRRGNLSLEQRQRPSVIVLRSFEPWQEEQFRKWGLVPVRSDAQPFFDELIAAVNAVLPHLSPGLKPGATPRDPKARTFDQQFRWLQVGGNQRPPEPHDFYQGDEPAWDDIVKDRDAIFEATSGVLSSLPSRAQDFNNPLQLVFALIGPRASGKSTALLRIGFELASRGFEVFLFRDESRLDVSATSWWLEHGPRSILLFDGCADSAQDIDKLAADAQAKNLPMIAIVTERDSRRSYVQRQIRREFLAEIPFERLSDSDIDAVLAKRGQAGRLGRLTDKRAHERREYFRQDAHRLLLVALADLEGAKGFSDRIVDDYERALPAPFRLLYGLACISYSLGYPLPVGIAAVAAGIEPVELKAAMDASDDLRSHLFYHRIGLRPRHRLVASVVVEEALTSDLRYELTMRLAKAIAAYVTPSAIRARSVPYRIARVLMDERALAGWLGNTRSRAWYEELLPFYRENARFWEQRALLEVRLNRFPAARSYAEQARSIRDDAYTSNTLGTVLLKTAIDYHTVGSPESERVFWEGVEYLRISRRLGSGEYEHPYVTFFTRSLDYMRHLKDSGKTDSRLLHEWHEWYSDAERSAAFSYPGGYEQLRDYQWQWLMLATGGGVR